MLKTSSTEPAEPKKSVVGVGDGGRNRAELVSKDEVDGDEDSSCGKSVKKLSKSRKIVKKSKSFKGLKNLQKLSVRRNVYQSTNPLSKNSNFCYNSDSFFELFLTSLERLLSRHS